MTQIPEAAHHHATEDPAQQQSAVPRREEGAAAAVASVRRWRGRDMVDSDEHCSQHQRAGAPELHGQQMMMTGLCVTFIAFLAFPATKKNTCICFLFDMWTGMDVCV